MEARPNTRDRARRSNCDDSSSSTPLIWCFHRPCRRRRRRELRRYPYRAYCHTRSRFGPMVIVPHLDVHDASDRVRTIGGGRAVFQNFDAFNCRFRNGAQIEEGARSAITDRVRRDTPAIDQERVSSGPRPRREIAVAPGVKPVALFEIGTPPPFATGRALSSCSAVSLRIY